VPERWTRTVLRLRIPVLGLWLAVLVVGVWSTSRLSPLLSNSFAVPGTDSERARTILARNFGERTDGMFTVVFRVAHPRDLAQQRLAKRRLAAAARVVPTGHPDVVRTGAGVLWADLDTNLDLRHAKRHTRAVRETLRAQQGPPAFVTGQPAIQHDLDSIFGSDLRRGEAFAVPIALLVLLAVFGVSLAAAIPFVFAACTITGTLAAVYAIAHALSMVTYVTNLVELIGIGLAIDYSLLVVYRFRDELASARSRGIDDAVVRTMATAGRAVVFSGTAVAIGLGLLLFVPVPFIRSMGVAGFVLPLVSIAACATLQPALLSLLGRRGVRRLQLRRRAGREGDFWRRLAAAVLRRPVVVLVASAGLLVAAAVPTAFLDLTPGSITGIPRSLESVRGFELLRDRVGPGVVTPTHIVLDAGGAGRARTRSIRAAVDRLGDELVGDPEAYVVASGTAAPYVDPTGRYARVIVVGRHEYGDIETRRFVDRLRSRIVPAAKVPAAVGVYAGGAPAQGVDFLNRSYGAFPWVVAAVLLLTFLILMRAFRSLVLPLKAVVLNMLSVAAVYGLLVVFFRWGLGADLLGLPQRSELDGWIPIFLFAVLFGLSMDYEVFLVSRIRESWDEVHDNQRAIAHGLERTGGIITAAALIMCAAFSGFVAGRVVALQEFGLGLALAVLIDATVVRALLAPSVMTLLGRWNWWLPRGLARVVHIE
jgi:putative drug exporter of the RND superfamily